MYVNKDANKVKFIYFLYKFVFIFLLLLFCFFCRDPGLSYSVKLSFPLFRVK